MPPYLLRRLLTKRCSVWHWQQARNSGSCSGFSKLFEVVDSDCDGKIGIDDLRTALDVLHRGDWKTYSVLAPLVYEGSVADGLSKEQLVEKLTQIHNSSKSSKAVKNTVLLHLDIQNAGNDLALEWRRIRERGQAFRRGLAQDSLLAFEAPSDNEFSRQKLRDQPALFKNATRIFEEPCPDGYKLAAFLGAGAFAKVFLVRNTATNNLQAMKVIDRDHMMKTTKRSAEQVSIMIEHEFRHIRHTDHPHVIRLVDFCQDKRYSYFITEAANGGSLGRALDLFYNRSPGNTVEKAYALRNKRLNETYVAEVLEQIAYALHYLHLDFRIHKDIKSENIMLLELDTMRPHAVLIDLGLAEVMLDEKECLRPPVPAGTWYTMAPEIMETFLGRRTQGFDQLSDIYSLGVVAFEMLIGRAPYELHEIKDEFDILVLLEVIRDQDPYVQLLKAGCSEEVAELVAQMMATDPSQRLSAKQVIHHPWTQKQRGLRFSKQIRADGRTAARFLGEEFPSLDRERELGELMERERRKLQAGQLVAFARRARQHRNVAYYLVNLHMPIARLYRTARWFRRLDPDLNGVLSYEAVAHELVEHASLDFTDALGVAQELDVNGSGDINLTDFCAARVSLDHQLAKRVTPWIFQAIEENWERSMDINEVPKILAEASGNRLQMSEIKEWLHEATAHVATKEVEKRLVDSVIRAQAHALDLSEI